MSLTKQAYKVYANTTTNTAVAAIQTDFVA